MKCRILLLCVCLILILVGCQTQSASDLTTESRTVSETDDMPDASEETDAEDWDVEERATATLREMRDSNWVGFTQEQMLEDLDYLYQSLLENYPYFGVVERTTGVDIHALYQEVRTQIPTLESDMDFYLAVSDMLQTIGGAGHLGTTWLDDEVSEPHDALAELVLPIYWELNAQKFQENDTMLPSTNVSAEILSEDEIAYVKINSFSFWTMEEDAEILFPFYEEVADYDHLIIDITGNGGGSMLYYRDLIMAPNLDDIAIFYSYQFMKEGQLNLDHMTNRGTPLYDFFLPVAQAPLDSLDAFQNIWLEQEEYDPVAVQKALENLPALAWPPEQIGEGDFAQLDYYEFDIMPVMPSGDHKTFQGRIWVLVDEAVYSSSESFAAYCKQTGFATLVGTQTSGDGIGLDPVEFPLPHSGIGIRYAPVYGTTIDGRGSEEFGTTPDIISPEGEAPLETCLNAIASSESE